MTKVTVAAVYTCSYCGIRRDDDTNHWLVLEVVPAVPVPSGQYLIIRRWNDLTASYQTVEHACGFDHATILFSRWLSTGSLQDGTSIARST